MSHDPVTTLRNNLADRWVFRYVFEYWDDKPAKRGEWFGASRPQDMASCQSKTNLLWAYIEGKHWTTKEVKRFGDCPGPDFLNFEHLAALIMTSGKQLTHVYGMRIIARNYQLTALEDGTTTYEPRASNYFDPEWTRY